MIDGKTLQVGILIREALGKLVENARNIIALDDELGSLSAMSHQIQECLEDIFLGDDADDPALIINDRKHADARLEHGACRFLKEHIR